MTILIFEGIATSGKTSVEQELATILANNEVGFEVISEDKTLMPILDNTDKEVGLQLLSESLDDAINKDERVIIFDRFHFTHVFRTRSTIQDFAAVEQELLRHNAVVLFLKVSEQDIPARIAWAIEHREKEWGEHVRRKGSMDEIIEYYKNQQRELEQVLTKTSLPVAVYDTSDLGFKRIAESIFKTHIKTA